MIDRWGNTVIIGWAEHELIWVRAAIRLGQTERSEAFRDIASMTGRAERTIRAMATKIRTKLNADIAAIQAAHPRRIMVPGRMPPGHRAAIPANPLCRPKEADMRALWAKQARKTSVSGSAF
jgi:hypothetical protein